MVTRRVSPAGSTVGQTQAGSLFTAVSLSMTDSASIGEVPVFVTS